jgi:hypothetical protein
MIPICNVMDVIPSLLRAYMFHSTQFRKFLLL